MLLALTLAALRIELSTRSVVWGNVAASLLWIAAMVLAIPFMSGMCRRTAALASLGLRASQGRVAVESLARVTRHAPVSQPQ